MNNQMATTHLEAIQHAYQEVLQATSLFALVEKPLWDAYCATAIKTLRAFQDVARPLDVALQRMSFQDRAALDCLDIWTASSLKQPDEVVLLIVAYRPYCKSAAESRLRLRLRIASALNGWEGTVRRVLNTSVASRTAVHRFVEHLRLVEREEDEPGSDDEGRSEQEQTIGSLQQTLEQVKASLAQFQQVEMYLPPSYCIKLEALLRVLSQLVQSTATGRQVHEQIEIVSSAVLSYRSQENPIVRTWMCNNLVALIKLIETRMLAPKTPEEEGRYE